jgi:hypothetical protein
MRIRESAAAARSTIRGVSSLESSSRTSNRHSTADCARTLSNSRGKNRAPLYVASKM